MQQTQQDSFLLSHLEKIGWVGKPAYLLFK